MSILLLPSPFARRFGIKSASFVTANHTANGRGKLSKGGTVIRKLSIAPRSLAALSLSMATQFLRCRRRSSLVTAVRFSNGQEAFPLTTAVQNIPVFLRKSLLHKKYFFGWLKTANISIVCGTVTLKSLLPQAFSVSNVHPRPRKRLSRCTLLRWAELMKGSASSHRCLRPGETNDGK